MAVWHKCGEGESIYNSEKLEKTHVLLDFVGFPCGNENKFGSFHLKNFFKFFVGEIMLKELKVAIRDQRRRYEKGKGKTIPPSESSPHQGEGDPEATLHTNTPWEDNLATQTSQELAQGDEIAFQRDISHDSKWGTRNNTHPVSVLEKKGNSERTYIGSEC